MPARASAASLPKSARPLSKRPYPLEDIRRYLEPGPIVLVTSRHDGQDNVMTMGWHMVLEFTPSLIGCVIASSNHSFEMIRRSGVCALNIPSTALTDQAVRIGNCSGADTDKFREFDLTTAQGEVVDVPLLTQCFANFECRVHDDAMVGKYNLFVFEVVHALVAPRPAQPETLHYQGGGRFQLSGNVISRRGLFRDGML